MGVFWHVEHKVTDSKPVECDAKVVPIDFAISTAKCKSWKISKNMNTKITIEKSIYIVPEVRYIIKYWHACPQLVASRVLEGCIPESRVPNGITSGDESAQRATSDAIWHEGLWIAARRHE